MKILIATKNKDKFNIVTTLLNSSILGVNKYYCLSDIDEEIPDKKEIGTILERSKEKAINAYKNLKNNHFDYIIGIDDGIKMKGVIVENVKQYIDDILNNEYLSQNEIVKIVRAYTFINADGKDFTITTEIPFKYKRLNKNIKIEPNSYPLSNVLTPINNDIPVKNMSEEDSNHYYLHYSEAAFIEVKNFYDNQ